MRRAGAVVLVGLGAFLLVGAVVLRLYAYPQLALAPKDQDSTSVLIGPDATIFDTATLSEITTDLTTTAKTTGDVAAADKAPDGTVVWVNTSSTRSSDGTIRSRSVDRAAFDAHTGYAVNCCDEYTETEDGVKEPVEHDGLLFKFPFETQEKTYSWWDDTLGEVVPMDYLAAEKLDGVPVYRFEGDVPRTVAGQRDVPGTLVDEPDTATVSADQMYQNHRTFWVEPHTGVVIKRLEERKETIAVAGEDKFTTTEVATQFTDETVQDNIDKYGTQGKLLGLVHGWLPWAVGAVGVLLLLLGLALQRRSAPRHA